MPLQSDVLECCRRAKLFLLEHYITGARAHVARVTIYSLTCILPRWTWVYHFRSIPFDLFLVLYLGDIKKISSIIG